MELMEVSTLLVHLGAESCALLQQLFSYIFPHKLELRVDACFDLELRLVDFVLNFLESGVEPGFLLLGLIWTEQLLNAFLDCLVLLGLLLEFFAKVVGVYSVVDSRSFYFFCLYCAAPSPFGRRHILVRMF